MRSVAREAFDDLFYALSEDGLWVIVARFDPELEDFDEWSHELNTADGAFRSVGALFKKRRG